MIPRFMVAALCVLGPLTCVAHGGNINGEATYISFSVPGALGTYPMSINASMEVTGYYNVSPTAARGFLREADGTITTFDVAGAVWTEPEGINAAGNITGYYVQAGAAMQGFLRYADGRTITFEGNPATYLGVQPVSINDFDEIAGTYVWRSPSVFTRSRAGVITTTIPVPNEASIATGINANGSVVGFYGGGGNDVFTGFVAHPDGYWAEIAVPGNSGCANQTIPDGINAAGMIAGLFTNNYYNDPACKPENTGGFVMSPDGNLTLFQPPGTMPELHDLAVSTGDAPWPHWISIDQVGDITGLYMDAAGVTHGFVRNPYGTITSFDPPEGKETNPTSINDGGAIAGFYQYHAGGGPPVGFIRVP